MTAPAISFRQRLESLPTWALIVLCAMYVIAPDILPFNPVDDLVVLGWTMFTILKRQAMANRGSLPIEGREQGSADATTTAM